MRILATLFCFLPWFAWGAAYLITSGHTELARTMPQLWTIISPFITAGVMLFAYREGKYSDGE